MKMTDHSPNSCASCGVYDCFRNAEKKLAKTRLGRTAFLVDQYWPEFDVYLQQIRQQDDWLLTPFNGRRFHKNQYAWNEQGYGKVYHQSWLTLRRAWQSRRLAQQGSARQLHLLRFEEKLALAMGKRLDFTIQQLTVWQGFLLPLHRQGLLGGRRYDVLMHRLPYQTLQEQLNQAADRYQDSPTLSDFRLPKSVVEQEWLLLQQAERIITPHAYMARLFPEKTVLLPWQFPVQQVKKTPSVVLKPSAQIMFVGPTAGRRGAYEMQEFLTKYPMPLKVLGRNVEKSGFWHPHPVQEETWRPNWLEGIGLVISLAYIDHQPRRLLEAANAGVSIISRRQSGLLEPVQLKGTHPQEQLILERLQQIADL